MRTGQQKGSRSAARSSTDTTKTYEDTKTYEYNDTTARRHDEAMAQRLDETKSGAILFSLCASGAKSV